MRALFGKRTSTEHEEEVQPQPLPVTGPALLREGPLLAPWYMVHRLEEEMERARRYGRPLAIVIAAPALLPGEAPDADVVEAATAAALKVARTTDLAGWLENSGLLIIMPETSLEGAEAAASRWRSELYLRTRSVGGKKWAVQAEAFWRDLPNASAFLASALDRTSAAA